MRTARRSETSGGGDNDNDANFMSVDRVNTGSWK
jgi:hypothetical protein